MEETECWIRPGQSKVIALLHGIGAKDPRDYWRAFLFVLLSDSALQDYGVFVWKYPTHVGPGKWTNLASTLTKRTLRETTPRIKQMGSAWDTTFRTQLHDAQDVFLICHSMGGLVVKSWIIDVLESGQSQRLEALRHISFYATPHNGAPITTLADWNKQLQDMQLDSPFIEDLGTRWHEHVVAWKDRTPGPQDRLYNRYIPHQAIAGLLDRVVPSTSATIRGIPLTTMQGDHSEVIQPGSIEDTRYKVWHETLGQAVHATARTTTPDPQAGQQISTPGQTPNTGSAYHSCVLSYATEDQAFVEKLYADLQASGVDCWCAEHDVKQGEKLREEIYRAIRQQKKLLLVLSQHAIESKWVEEEVDVALDREHQQLGTWLLFPLRLDETVFTTDKYWAITVRQRRIGDFRQWQDDEAYQRALQRLLRDLQV